MSKPDVKPRDIVRCKSTDELFEVESVKHWSQEELAEHGLREWHVCVEMRRVRAKRKRGTQYIRGTIDLRSAYEIVERRGLRLVGAA